MHSTRIVIDNAAAGTPISRDLWGIFFEDINYSADGGLYGELAQNRSFDYTNRDHPGWHALTGWLTPTPVRVESSEPLHPNTPHYVILDASASPDDVALTNEGFDGIPLTQGGTYRFTVFGRVLGEAPVTLRVELVDRESIIADAELVVTGSAWTAYEVILTAQRTFGHAALRLKIQLPAPPPDRVPARSPDPDDRFPQDPRRCRFRRR